MIKKRTQKIADWVNVQQNFSDLLQHQSKNNVQLDESHLSQQIDDETADSHQFTDEASKLLIEDESSTPQLIEDKVSPLDCAKRPGQIETAYLQDSADLFASPTAEISSVGCDCRKLHPKCGLITPLHQKNLFSSPIFENVTPKRQSGIFSESLIRCCTPKRRFNSVISNETPTSSKVCKSTPSGSPILKRSCQKLQGNHRRTLIPLSPITPGLNWTNFTSVFSVHADETSLIHETEDQTILATPLDATDDQIDEFTEENQDNKNDEVEVAENCKSQISCLKAKNVLNTTGSNWIKNVQDKIDEDWRRRAARLAENTSTQDEASLYDSGKKNKFVKGGLADKLSKVLKREQSQKSIFLQKLQTKKLQRQDSLLLKVLSDEKDGLLRIVECKAVENDINVVQTCTYALILPEDFADTLCLTLGLDICVYQPFQTVRLPSSNTTVVLSAYNIISQGSCDKESCLDSGSDSFTQSQSKTYENLLNCLETHTSCDENISIVATIQRIFCHFKSSSEKWSMLCIDAYGTAFLLDSQSFSNDPNLVVLLSCGEGQRVIFKNVFLKDRMTRSQYPALFSIVDSVWDPSGSGLLHSSQSQHSGEFISLLPPSYCYLLSADETTSAVFPGKEVDSVCSKKGCDKKNCRILSTLNRLPCGDHKNNFHTDTLYCLPKIVKLAEILDKSFERNRRCSIICQFVEFKSTVDCDSQDLYCSQHNDNDVTVLIKEYDTDLLIKNKRNYEVTAKNCCLLPHNMIEESTLVFKDIFVNTHSLVADQFTRVKLIDCICEGHHFLNFCPSDAES